MPETSLSRQLAAYVRGRAGELARAETLGQSEPLAQWATRRIRLDARGFSFEGHEYLRAIYDDTSFHVVLCKAAQIGGTVWALLRSFHACLHGLNVVYYFPTRSDVIEFSKSRVAPLIAQNPFLAEQMKETDTAGLKQIGSANLYFRGMQSAVGLKSVPADLLVFDELDEATPEAKAMAKERLAHSSYKRIIELSNPSLPEFGIDESYQKSDQRHWTLKCSSCGAWASLDQEFPKKLGLEVKVLRERSDGSVYRACVKCSAELDIDKGEWVADFPGREIHGYRISQLFSAQVDAKEILLEYRLTRYPDRFFNLKIGVPYADLDLRLDEASVLSSCTDDLLWQVKDEPLYMGIDTGRELHVVILAERFGPEAEERRFAVVGLKICQGFDELDALIVEFKIERAVIDGLPETHATREFAKRHPGKVFLNFFNEHQRGKPRWDSESMTVQTNRTEALDAPRAALRNKSLLLPRREPIVELFAKHIAADAKQLDEDPDTGTKRYRYIRTGADHLSLALTYAFTAAEHQSGASAWLSFMRSQVLKMKHEQAGLAG